MPAGPYEATRRRISFNQLREKPWYSRSITCRLAYLTDYTPDLINASLHLLEKLYHPSQEFVKWGIKLRDLTPRARPRRNLFDDRNQIRNVRLMKAVDYTMPTTAPGTIHFGDLGTLRGSKPQWSMRAELMSPRYATRWDELPIPT